METKTFRHDSCGSGGDCTFPELQARTGQQVEIIRPLTLQEADEEVGPMFHIRFGDGFEADAFEDELS